MPIAISAAFWPTTPPPMTMTLPAATPGHAAQQQPAAAERLLEHEGARLRGDLARHLAHRRQQRQPPAGVLDRLVGDARRARRDQAPRQLGVGRQVQVGEERVARLQPRDLLGLGLLDLDDQVGLAEDRVGVGQDLRALRDVVARRLIAEPSPAPGLHDDLVAAVGELAHARRGQRDAVLVGLDLGGDADLHWWTSLSTGGRATISRPRSASQNSMRSRAELRSRPVSSSILRMR